jgi:NAD(P)-dependent dehydrogenase (short-subunit alcohol dehydrogenase family)
VSLPGNVDASAGGIRADVTSNSDMLRVAETIRTAHGQVDIVFANAGAGHATPIDKLTEQIDSELSIKSTRFCRANGAIQQVKTMSGKSG